MDHIIAMNPASILIRIIPTDFDYFVPTLSDCVCKEFVHAKRQGGWKHYFSIDTFNYLDVLNLITDLLERIEKLFFKSH